MNNEMTLGLEPNAGTVHLTVVVNAPLRKAWNALTNPDAIGSWFASLSAPLRQGGSAVLDFGDGDVFTLEGIHLTPPQLAQYTWRFLGIGPPEVIRWRLAERGEACAVTVADTEDERPAEGVAVLREGWSDFLTRLDQFLTTGKPTRYDWRREFDGSVVLPCNRPAAWSMLMEPGIGRWLQLDGKILESGTHLVLADQGPSGFEVAAVTWQPPDQVSFEVHHPGGSCPTRCQLRVSDRGTASSLSVNHTGWEGLTPDPQEPPRQRRCFSRFWIEALTQARRYCGSRYSPTNCTP